MCTRPRVIVNPYFKVNLCSASSVFIEGCECSPDEVYNHPVTYSFLHDRVEHSPSEYLSLVKNSFLLMKDGSHRPVYTLLPCGKCLECRESYRKQIEYRSMIEAANSAHCVFYTLTYDDSHLPHDGLHKEHVSSAFKRLRTYVKRALDFKVTFVNLYVGEYGTDPRFSLRPHYHGLLYIKEHLTDAQMFQFRQLFVGTHSFYDDPYFRNGYIFYKSFWPHGSIIDFVLCHTPLAASRYITKYVTKNQYFNCNSRFHVLKELTQSHWNPCFVQLPKRIGLGCAYLPKYVDSILNSKDMSFFVAASDGSIRRIGIPTIFVKKLFPTLGTSCPDAPYIMRCIGLLIHNCVKCYLIMVLIMINLIFLSLFLSLSYILIKFLLSVLKSVVLMRFVQLSLTLIFRSMNYFTNMTPFCLIF